MAVWAGGIQEDNRTESKSPQNPRKAKTREHLPQNWQRRAPTSGRWKETLLFPMTLPIEILSILKPQPKCPFSFLFPGKMYQSNAAVTLEMLSGSTG